MFRARLVIIFMMVCVLDTWLIYIGLWYMRNKMRNGLLIGE